jgi:hypothetical protein
MCCINTLCQCPWGDLNLNVESGRSALAHTYTCDISHTRFLSTKMSTGNSMSLGMAVGQGRCRLSKYLGTILHWACLVFKILQFFF